MSSAALILALALVPAKSVAALPEGASGTPVVIEVEGAQVSAIPVVTGIAQALPVPMELTAVAEQGKAAPARVSVKLCEDWQCVRFQVVRLSVAKPGQPPVPVIRRLPQGGTFAIVGMQGTQQASGSVTNGGGQALLGVIGTFEVPLPDAGWKFKAQYGGQHVQGGVSPIAITEAIRRFPDLVHGYAAIVLAPNTELTPVVRTSLGRYLRAGGTLIAPRAIADQFRPRIGEAADAKAVLDGTAQLQTTPIRLRADAVPELATRSGQMLRPLSTQVELPVTATPVQGGLLLAYEEGTTGVQIVDAVLIARPNWTRDEYDFQRQSQLGNQARSGASVLLARVPPIGWILLGLLLWGAVVVVVTRRSGRRRPWRTIAQLGAVSAVLVVLVVAGGRLSRGEGKEVTVRIVSVLDDADFGYEYGVRVRSVPNNQVLKVEGPRGTWVRPLYVDNRNRTRGAHRELEPHILEVSATADRPAGVAWFRPTPVTSSLRYGPAKTAGAESGAKSLVVLHNGGNVRFDYVAVFGDLGDRWSKQPLEPGAELLPRSLRNRYEVDRQEPADLREAAVRRIANEVGSQCPHTETKTGGRRRRCAIGFSVTPEGIDAVVTVPRQGPAYQLPPPAEVPAPDPTGSEDGGRP